MQVCATKTQQRARDTGTDHQQSCLHSCSARKRCRKCQAASHGNLRTDEEPHPEPLVKAGNGVLRAASVTPREISVEAV